MLRKVTVWKLLCILFVMTIALSIIGIVQAAIVTTTISVGTAPTGVAYDSARSEIFVANSGSNTVSIISDVNNAVVKTVTVGTSPTGLAYDSNKSEIFVTNHRSNSVSVISDISNSVIKTIPVGTSPNNIAYDSGKGEIFVVNSGDNTVSIISDVSNAIVANVTVGTNPNKVVYDAAKGELYVSNSGYNTVSVISDSSNTVIATITVGISPAGAAYDSLKGEIFVANYGSGANSVSVISDSSHLVLTTVPVGTVPYGVAYNSGLNEIFVTNHNSNSVSVISDSNNSVVATIPVGNTPAGVAYDSGKGEIFVANMGDNTVSIIPDALATSPSSSPVASTSPTPVTSATINPTVNPTSNPTQTTGPSSNPDLLQQVWVPKPENAVAAVGISALAIGAVSLLFSSLSNPLGEAGGALAEKTKGLIPDNIKEWLQDVVASRRKVEIGEKTGSPFIPTKLEILAYTTAIIVLAISFAYVKVITLNQIWALLPVFFVTSVLVGFVQKFFSIAYLRHKGVWSEHKIWPFGLVLFLFTTFAFRVPFSSPTRNVNQSKKFTEHLGALVAASEILISLAFGGLFFLLLSTGYVAIGGAGLDMCIIGSFFGTFPVSPMSGKEVFKHSKRLWAGLFITTLIIFCAWLLLMQ
jgi:YVTN family beta-propeller protein